MAKLTIYKAVEMLVAMGIIDRVYPGPAEVERRREGVRSRIIYYYLPAGTTPFAGWTPDMDRQGRAKTPKPARQTKARMEPEEATADERRAHTREVMTSTERRPSRPRGIA